MWAVAPESMIKSFELKTEKTYSKKLNEQEKCKKWTKVSPGDSLGSVTMFEALAIWACIKLMNCWYWVWSIWESLEGPEPALTWGTFWVLDATLLLFFLWPGGKLWSLKHFSLVCRSIPQWEHWGRSRLAPLPLLLLFTANAIAEDCSEEWEPSSRYFSSWRTRE